MGLTAATVPIGLPKAACRGIYIERSCGRSRKRMMHKQPYGRLAVMTVAMMAAMYVLMYAMVDRFDNVYSNLNQFYMAGLMTAPMVWIELAVMPMYPNRAANWAIAAVSLVALVGFWIAIRQQVAIADVQFLKSMIPHHAGALLMCEKAPVGDSEIRALCEQILRSQQAEIDQMQAILARLR